MLHTVDDELVETIDLSSRTKTRSDASGDEQEVWRDIFDVWCRAGESLCPALLAPDLIAPHLGEHSKQMNIEDRAAILIASVLREASSPSWPIEWSGSPLVWAKRIERAAQWRASAFQEPRFVLPLRMEALAPIALPLGYRDIVRFCVVAAALSIFGWPAKR